MASCPRDRLQLVIMVTVYAIATSPPRPYVVGPIAGAASDRVAYQAVRERR